MRFSLRFEFDLALRNSNFKYNFTLFESCPSCSTEDRVALVKKIKKNLRDLSLLIVSDDFVDDEILDKFLKYFFKP